MKKRIFLYCVSCLLVCLVSCSKCNQTADSAEMAMLIPGDVPGVLIFPDLSTTIADFNALTEKFAKGPAAPFFVQAKKEVARELGFDPFDAKGWNSIGLDPKTGLGVVLDPIRTMIIVGVSDKSKFEKEVAKRLKEMSAAEEISTSKIDGTEVVTIAAKVGERTVPRLFYSLKGPYAMIAGPTGSPELLASCTKLTKEKSLAGAKWFVDLSKKMPKNPDLVVFVNGPKAQTLLQGRQAELAMTLKEGMALALSIAPQGISTDCFLGLDLAASKKLKSFTSSVSDAQLQNKLPADTVFALKLSFNAAKLLETALSINPEAKTEFDKHLAKAKEMLQTDVEAATINNLSGNAILGLSLGSPDKVNKLIAARGQDIKDIGAAFRLLGWLGLKDGKKYAGIVEKAIEVAGERMPATRSKAGPLDVLTLPTEKGFQVHLLHHDNLTGFCLGQDCPGQAAKLIEAKAENLSSVLSAEAKKLFSEPSLVAGYLNFGRVVDVLAGLEAATFGKGGLAVKLVLDRVMFRGHLKIQ
ncbi:MAG: DUF3352 domain-containing protein [Deltaproteobacteria bacterium]|nr:DUF3352 domain-containing protein [Deltaproteobacteria bacterium]